MILSQTITTQELIQSNYTYNYTSEELREDWLTLCRTYKFKTGSQFRPGMKLCQHFCDNFWLIENEAGDSFAKAWRDPVIMDKVRLWGLGSMPKLYMSWIRRAVFMTAGLPNSSFYRPHFAKQIIMRTNKLQGKLFDPCAGWGGRMLGTLAANWQYTACEPNYQTFMNLQKITKFISKETEVKLYNTPVENFDVKTLGEIDIVLTSPPYFNLEVYNRDTNQSYNKYPDYNTWRDLWLYPLIERSTSVLSADGISAWNVMNFKQYDFAGDVIKKHIQLGYKLVDTIGFKSPLSNIRKLKNRDVTYIFEPIK